MNQFTKLSIGGITSTLQGIQKRQIVPINCYLHH